MDESLLMNDHPANRLGLIDVSSEDDSLLYSRLNDFSSHRSTDDQNKVQSSELLEAINDEEGDDSVDYFEKWEHQSPQLIQPLETVSRKDGKLKYNLRKSLAWDSAFFTSAGVLDPEELSSIIGGVEKLGKSSLHTIQEDVRNSDDSIPALENDCSSIASADADLFEDIRASIQKSAKVNNAKNSGGKSSSGGKNTERVPSSERKGLGARNKNQMEDAIPSKKTSVHKLVSGKLLKHGSVCSQVPQRKTVEKLAPSSTALTKRVSPGNNLVKVENDETKKKASGKGTMKIKATTSEISKPSIYGSKPLLARKDAHSLTVETSRSITSDSNKSPSNSTKRNTLRRNSKTPSSGSTGKASYRAASRTDTHSGKSLPSNCSVSVSKHSSETSPVSSISEWSSDMSSCLFERSSRASLDTSSLVSEASEAFETLDHADNQHLGGHETRSIKKASPGSDSVSSVSKQPSSLRLPSPKIGFFDGVKSADMKHHPVSCNLPKGRNGNSISSGSINKSKVMKIQQARTMMAIRSTKPDCPQTSPKENLKSSKSYPRNSNDANKDSVASRNFRSGQVISREIRHQLSPGQPQMNKKCQIELEASASMEDVRPDGTNI